MNIQLPLFVNLPHDGGKVPDELAICILQVFFITIVDNLYIVPILIGIVNSMRSMNKVCLLYTSDAADE